MYGMIVLGTNTTAVALDALATRTRKQVIPTERKGILSQIDLMQLATILASLGVTIAMNRAGLHADRVTHRDRAWGVAYGTAAAVAAFLQSTRRGQHAPLSQTIDLGNQAGASVAADQPRRTALPAAVLLVRGTLALTLRLRSGAWGYFGVSAGAAAVAACAVLALERVASRLEHAEPTRRRRASPGRQAGASRCA